MRRLQSKTRLVLIAPAAFVSLLGLFLAFRAALIAIPVDVLDAFEKSSIGTQTALAFLLLQPFGCLAAAKRIGASPAAAWWVFGAGVLSSVLLFLPALLIFME